MTMKISAVAGAGMLDGLKALLNSGSLVIYSGVQPATPDTALSADTVLATFTFNNPAFGSDGLSGGFEQATASFVATTVTAVASGTAAFARAFKSDGTTVIADFTVGTSGADINLNSTGVTINGNVTLSSLLLKMPVD